MGNPTTTILCHIIIRATLIRLKRYAQPTIRYNTRYDAHDTIRSAIHWPFLPGKQRLVIPACDQKHCTPPTTTACTVMVRSGYNNGGLLGVSRCSRPKGKTTTGSALDGAVFDTAQILAYLVHNMSRSQLYLGFGHFGWLPSFFGQ